jgi:stalled ribosome rescue protein Dom34
MLLEPTHRFNTWKLERIETKGNYSEALEKLEDGTATVAWVKDYVNKEYLKCKEKFKRKKCSDKNNIMHFIVNLTVQMLNTIK